MCTDFCWGNAFPEKRLRMCYINYCRKVSYYVYMELVWAELQAMLGWHNDHLIRWQPGNIISGKPLVLYLGPEEYGM